MNLKKDGFLTATSECFGQQTSQLYQHTDLKVWFVKRKKLIAPPAKKKKCFVYCSKIVLAILSIIL